MNFEDNFPERIDLVINKLNGPSEFARQTGVTLSTIARWRKGEAEPSRPNLIKIAEVANVSIEWLATGKESQSQAQQGIVERAFNKFREMTGELISMINSFGSINVSAGFGSFNEGITKPDGQEPYADSLLQKLGVKADNCGVFWANGTSMEPTICDGDQMLVDFSKKEARGDDKIYLIQNGESVWVKRVKMKWDGVELVSDNKDEYPPITISDEDAKNLQIIGQVVHIGKSLV
ncbi:TPA: XRE family transcriptional regulator [Pasteurella multocida]|uniref:XRE family transcriptional regulator n=1 Tax=Pasteurella multocida TaxID=747 RepID=UPI00189A1475|nr:helix-turn-helix transcriptional regulator [Pasteurella multocida]MBF6982395.1 helix-turn-helix transcriptional regulator [Pasteurella multocida]